MKRSRFIGAGAAALAAANGRAVAQIVPGQPLPYGQFLQQLTIAVNVTLSGDLGKYGLDVFKGVQAAVDEQNRFNAPISHAWACRGLDDRNDQGVAQSNVNVAAADSTVVAVVGSLTAAMTLAALPRYANQTFAVVVPTVTADAVTQRGYHNVYRLPAKDSTSGKLFAQAALEGRRGVNAIAVAFDGDYGYEVARGFVGQAQADHHQSDVLLFPSGTVDPAGAARSILDRSPGYVFLAGKTTQMGPIASALRLAGYTADFGASDGFFNLETISTYAAQLDGAWVASSLPPINKIPSATSLITDFQREVGAITLFSQYGYAAAQLIISAAQQAGAASRTNVLRSLQRGGSYTTLAGQFSFNYAGDPLIPNIYLYVVGKDGFRYLRPAVRTGFVL
jgi:ABC-type branched-subunit amino acid transport system substrate-binding protein